ncbi:hypothetical protein DL95DRAFT_386586 [Leptodontidium sp. 2 PMI_412]|nr:hypothetical protein DL95DRAFT_386586 [Leptodontidium sp. 2 PMI_412]
MRSIIYLTLFTTLALSLPAEFEKKDEATAQTAAKTCGPGFDCTNWCCSQAGCNGSLHCDGSYCLSLLNECVCNCRYN